MKPPYIRKRNSFGKINLPLSQPTLISRRPKEGLSDIAEVRGLFN